MASPPTLGLGSATVSPKVNGRAITATSSTWYWAP